MYCVLQDFELKSCLIVIFHWLLLISAARGTRPALNILPKFQLEPGGLSDHCYLGLMSVRVPSMSVLPPVRRDRIIAQLPQFYSKKAAVHTKDEFNSKVKTACQEQRTGTVGFKIAKVIVVGDLAVGKTCLINRFCKDAFDKNYKATIGVDFEMERFEVLGVPFSLQLWDTAGQERFKCIASTYYRGAQTIVIVFDVNDVASLGHARQWLEDALKENDPTNVQLFLVGTKKDLSVCVYSFDIHSSEAQLIRFSLSISRSYFTMRIQLSHFLTTVPVFTSVPVSPAQYSQIEQDAIELAEEIKAEYWALSSLTGENVREFFFRIASLAFEANVLAELEKSGSRHIGDVIKINSNSNNVYATSKKKQSNCCQ
ncbi:ras-related protein Rab-34 isoform X2 [Oncorhynchus mykiss]|uniref:ras-related protein Rab-34 isoform X2 n=2 Tax=Oncorhynchus mykiss TaxID=8022 RepID=UPI00187887DE|nr:ras-related protein Rab-34 isoform X2 [Oncorhynchus mykiss]